MVTEKLLADVPDEVFQSIVHHVHQRCLLLIFAVEPWVGRQVAGSGSVALHPNSDLSLGQDPTL